MAVDLDTYGSLTIKDEQLYEILALGIEATIGARRGSIDVGCFFRDKDADGHEINYWRLEIELKGI